jgi:hypothetical protein
MAKNTGSTQGEGNGTQASATRGKYTVLEAQDVQVTVPVPEGAAEGTEPTTDTVQAYVAKGEVTARSKNDAIRTAFNEGLIEGAGTYAAVTSRSFAPVKVEPKVRTALSWS